MCLPPLDFKAPDDRELTTHYLFGGPNETFYKVACRGLASESPKRLIKYRFWGPWTAESDSLGSRTLPGNSDAHEHLRAQLQYLTNIWWIKTWWKVLRSLFLKICSISFIPLGYIFAGDRSREFDSVMDQSGLMGNSLALFSNKVMKSTYCPVQMPN